MKKYILIILALFSFSAIHAEITWTLKRGTLTISGTGDMPDYRFVYDTNHGQTTAPWYSEREKIKKIVIEDGVTSIGKCAFHNCESLTSVTIPNSVTYINLYAFKECDSLTSITIPNSVKLIEEEAFSGCSRLTSVTLSNSLVVLGWRVFGGCYSLKSVIIPNSVKTIGWWAFSSCMSLTSVVIPDSVTSIGYRVFEGCESLTSITFEGSTPPEFGKDVFKDVNKSIPVYVPANSIEAYKKALGGYFPETSIRALQR